MAVGFEEALFEIGEGEEREALITAAVVVLSHLGGSDDADYVAKTVSYLAQITDETKREELRGNWLRFIGGREPEKLPVVEEALLRAGLRVESERGTE